MEVVKEDRAEAMRGELEDTANRGPQRSERADPVREAIISSFSPMRKEALPIGSALGAYCEIPARCQRWQRFERQPLVSFR